MTLKVSGTQPDAYFLLRWLFLLYTCVVCKVKLDDVRSQLHVSLMENRKLEADLDKLVSKVLQVPLDPASCS